MLRTHAACARASASPACLSFLLNVMIDGFVTVMQGNGFFQLTFLSSWNACTRACACYLWLLCAIWLLPSACVCVCVCVARAYMRVLGPCVFPSKKKDMEWEECSARDDLRRLLPLAFDCPSLRLPYRCFSPPFTWGLSLCIHSGLIIIIPSLYGILPSSTLSY